SQDYPNIEYIVMDGASRDDTADVVAPYADRLRFISEPDRGQSHAINKGFALARGEIVAWLNSDDVFLPGAISKAVAAFAAHPHAGVVYGEGYQIDIDGNIKSRFPHTQPFDLWRLTHLSDYILQQSVFFRKAALDEVGEIREDLHYIMDWEILIRLGKAFEFVYVPEFFGSLREYDTAKTFSGGTKRAAEIRAMLRTHTNMFLPEGYIVYGLDAYSQLWNNQIENWPDAMRWLKIRAQNMVRKMSHRIIGQVTVHRQGLYGDQWMTRKARFMLRRGAGDVVFAGHRPGISELEGQTVTISSGGRVCSRNAIGAGDFEIRFAAPPSAAQEAATFEVSFSKAFVPAQKGGSEDTRALSSLFHHFDWAKNA
ncbi:MAG: glycosyltransferase, partial [Candidatus Eremiobacteraeota bacterium]|nr:glycosyltransferase [Candidatus Eremiobacteraeota bacterium]